MRRFSTPFVFLLYFFFASLTLQAQDAGVAAITQPTGTVCRGSASVEATLHNYGAVDISTCTVQWTVNGVAQTAYSFIGTLTPGSDAAVTLGNYNFNAGAYSIVAYSENPNGSADVDNSNDTSTATVNTQLSGIYTLGGATPDYTTFTDAVNDLNAIGICGAVTFNVRNGTYNEKLLINQILGSSASNTITFQSETADSDSVILNTPSVDSTTVNNYLIRLNGTDYLTLRQMTLERSGISANARILDYTNTATFNVITNCHLLGVNNGITANSFGALVYSSGGTPFNDSMNTFSNNLLENGSIGIYFNGVSTLSLESGTMITDNDFVNQFASGIQFTYQDAAVISGNMVTSNSTLPSYYGIFLSACLRNTMITKNKIVSAPGNGMYLIDCSAFPTPRAIVSNNFVNTLDSSGITLLNGANLDVAFNSVHVQGTTATNSALALRGRNNGMEVKDNALVNSGGGYAYVISDSGFAGLTSSNYNDLYTTGLNVGNYRGTDEAAVADWQAAASHDTNSVSIDPVYVSASDLHATSLNFDNKGIPFASVAVDIDNDTRNGTTPDIGADEYTGFGHDVAVITMLSPMNNDCESATASVSVVVHNYGGYTETNIPVQVDITGAFTATLNDVVASLVPGGDFTLTFTANLNTIGGGDATFIAYTQLAIDDVRSNDTLNSGLIHINATPALPTVTSDSICGPGSVTLMASSSDSLFWYSDSTGGTLLFTGSPFNTPSISTTTTYYVEARNFCSSARVAVDAIIMPLPNVNLGNDTSILIGSNIVLDAGAGYTTYVWSTGDNTQTITQSPVVPTCYNVTVLDGNGCINSDTICVNVVFPSDVGVQSLVSPADHQCENAATPISIIVANFGSTTATDIPLHITVTGSANLSFNDTLFGSIPSGGSVPFTTDSTINTTGGGTYTITASTNYATDQLHSNDTLITTIIVNPIPAEPLASDASRCGAGPVSLTATATDTVYWFDAATAGNLLGIGTYNIPFLAVTDTFYAQAGFSCPSLTRKEVIVTILPLPPVSLGADQLIPCGTFITLDAGAGYVVYSWSTGESTQTISVDTLNDYSATVTDTNGCSNSDTVHIDCFVGVNAIAINNNVKVFPNPTSGVINVELNSSVSDATVRWMDINGQVVSEDKMNGVRQRQYDLSNAAKGIYLLQIITADGVSMHRVVIE